MHVSRAGWHVEEEDVEFSPVRSFEAVNMCEYVCVRVKVVEGGGVRKKGATAIAHIILHLFVMKKTDASDSFSKNMFPPHPTHKFDTMPMRNSQLGNDPSRHGSPHHRGSSHFTAARNATLWNDGGVVVADEE